MLAVSPAPSPSSVCTCCRRAPARGPLSRPIKEFTCTRAYVRVRAIAGNLVVLERYPLCTVCARRSAVDPRGVTMAVRASEVPS
jgi:hypothetical protein